MKGELTRQHIIETAAQMFWHGSYHAVGMADIARNANVNKATPYQYFESKEALVLDVVEHNLSLILEQVFDASFAENAQPLKRLASIYERVSNIQQAMLEATDVVPGCPFGNLGAELSTDSEPVRLKINAVMDRLSGYYRQIIRDHRGKYSKREASDAASLIRNMNGALLTAKLQQRPAAIMDALPLARTITIG